MDRLRWLPALLIFLLLFVETREMRQPETVRGEEDLRYRWVYDNPGLFAELSPALRSELETQFGTHPLTHAAARAGQSAGTLVAPTARTRRALVDAPRAAPANVLVNDPAADSGTADMQTSPTLAFGGSDEILAAFNDTGASGGVPRLTGVARSTDGGASFRDGGALPPGLSGDAGAPVLARDAAGEMAYLVTRSALAPQTLLVFRMEEKETVWRAPVNSAPGFTEGVDLHDRPWIAVDNAAGPCGGAVYQTWRNLSSFSARNGITFNRSTSGGDSWAPSGGLLLAVDGHGPMIVVGPDHTVYVFWRDPIAVSPGRIAMRASADCGQSFGPAITVARIASTGLNGDLGLEVATTAFPQAAVNPVSGELYVAYNDRGAQGDRADIYLTRSLDKGFSWLAPERVNDDATSTDQFMPSLAVQPDGSGLILSYYSRQLDPARNRLVDLWGRIAASGGAFGFGAGFRISTESFPVPVEPDPVLGQATLGERTAALAGAGVYYCAWTDTRARDAANRRQQADIRLARLPAAGPGAIMTLGEVTVGSGNGNGVLDPNECATLNVTLRNLGSATASGLRARLRSATDGVNVSEPDAVYADIAAGASGGPAAPFRVALSPSIPCGTRVALTLDVTTGPGEGFTIPLSLITGSAGSPLTFSSAAEGAIPDGGTLNAPLAVSGLSAPVGKVIVQLYITHGYDADLDITLVAPDGTTVELSTDNGGSGANYGSSCANGTRFDDAAPVRVSAGSAPFAGAYQPEGLLSALIGKAGSAVNGVWTLRVSDDNNYSDSGRLHCWSLTIAPLTCREGGGVCGAPRTPDANGDGVVDATDALCILRLLGGFGATAACPSPLSLADVNGDGSSTAVDALCVLRFATGLPASIYCPASRV